MDDSFEFRRRNKSRLVGGSFFSPKTNKCGGGSRDQEDSNRVTTVTFSSSPPTITNFTTDHHACSPVPSSSKTATIMDLLYTAIESRNVDLVVEMLYGNNEYEVDVNQIMPEYPISLLHLAVGFSSNDPEIVDILCKFGGDPNNANSEEGVSPLHLSAINDYDKVMAVLMTHGGDPELCTAEGLSCYDFVKRNVDNLTEKCFSYLFQKSKSFRKSLGPTPKARRQNQLDNGSDRLYDFDSLIEEVDTTLNGTPQMQTDGVLHSAAKRLFPKDYSYLMTEDESTGNSVVISSSDDDDTRKKLTTIAEESGIGFSPVSIKWPTSRIPSPPALSFLHVKMSRGIGSMTAPQYLLTDDESYLSQSSINKSNTSATRNNLMPPTPLPTKEDIEKLRKTVQELKTHMTSASTPLADHHVPSRANPLVLPRHTGLNSSSRSTSESDDTSPSCVNSTPPFTPQPTSDELEKLRKRMQGLKMPVTPSTFGVISKYAQSESRLESLLTPKTGTKNLSSELQAGIEDFNLIHEWGKHKIDFLQNATPTANRSKSFYNYLLLDPKIIKRVNFSGDSLKANVINSSEKFEKFISSVFYIGKAHGRRPLDHLVEAKKKFMEIGKRPLKNGEKIDKIVEIWRGGMGVMIISVFHHSSEREANVNEASMIDAMGLVELSNLKKGSYTGTVASEWSQKVKNQFGSLLLYKAYCSFVVSDPKQFYAQDF